MVEKINMIKWRRAKVLELNSQGHNQSEIARVIQDGISPFTEIQMFSICSIWQVCVMLAYVVALFAYIPTSNIPQGCYLDLLLVT